MEDNTTKKDAFIDLDSSSVWHLRGYFSNLQILRPNTIAFMGGICDFAAEIALYPMSLSQRTYY